MLPLLFILLIIVEIFPSDRIIIKSLLYYNNWNTNSFPVINISEENNSKLTIEFDVQSSSYPALSISFIHCDINWNPTENNFITNRGQKRTQMLILENLPGNIQHARYHFIGSYPDTNNEIVFPYSGKWMFLITDLYDETNIYASGKFYVVENLIEAKTILKDEIISDATLFPADLARRNRIETEFYLNENFFPFDLTGIEIIKNRLINFPFFIQRTSDYTSSSYYEWDGRRTFTFIQKNIFPGNEYRQIDLRNTNLYQGYYVNAQRDGLEYSRLFKKGNKDFNGGALLMNYKDNYADYLSVTFSIRPTNPIYGDVYLIGAFSNWKLLPELKMKETDGIYSCSYELKRGAYDYQYIVVNNNNYDWTHLEGNFLETTNTFHSFIFYREKENGGYDRIIGYSEVRKK